VKVFLPAPPRRDVHRNLVAPASACLVLCLVLAGCGSPAAEDAALAPGPRGPGPFLSDGASVQSIVAIASFDGHVVPGTLYRPTVADAGHPVPMLLHSHGFAGSRARGADAFEPYIAAGFGVLSFDMRGHGEARTTSQIRVHDMEYEIRDVSAVVDYVATLDWVLLDAPGDPRLGTLGGSYGGGYQLLAAASDARIDAIAPQVTWNDLVQSLAPNGVIKTAWVDLLYGTGVAFGNFHDSIHRGYAFGQTTGRFPDGTLPGEPDLVTAFQRSSPAYYPDAIRVPTLLIHGVPDTLFNLDQLEANYRQISATGAPVGVVTHFSGHILNTQGSLPGSLPVPVGLQPPRGDSPCGDIDEWIIAWYHQHLLGVPGEPAPLCFAVEGGDPVQTAAWPTPTPSRIDIGTLATEGRVAVEVLRADASTLLLGAPRLTGNLSVTGTHAETYWTLERVGLDGARHELGSQVTPQRAGAGAFDLNLMSISALLQPGESLELVAAAHHPQFAHTGRPGTGLYQDLALWLPLQPESGPI
jgi:ABC-2 type transport system ATP-binding protein